MSSVPVWIFFLPNCLLQNFSMLLNRSGKSEYFCFFPYLRGVALSFHSLKMMLAGRILQMTFVRLRMQKYFKHCLLTLLVAQTCGYYFILLMLGIYTIFYLFYVYLSYGQLEFTHLKMSSSCTINLHIVKWLDSCLSDFNQGKSFSFIKIMKIITVIIY